MRDPYPPALDDNDIRHRCDRRESYRHVDPRVLPPCPARCTYDAGWMERGGGGAGDPTLRHALSEREGPRRIRPVRNASPSAALSNYVTFSAQSRGDCEGGGRGVRRCSCRYSDAARPASPRPLIRSPITTTSLSSSFVVEATRTRRRHAAARAAGAVDAPIAVASRPPRGASSRTVPTRYLQTPGAAAAGWGKTQTSRLHGGC